MINTLGSFAAIFLVLWLLLSILFLFLYPLIRPAFLNLHPRFGSALLLAYWTGPFLISLLSTGFLFMPNVESMLVDAHCHEACTSHVPLIHSLGLASVGLAACTAVLLILAFRCVRALRQAWQLRTQFGLMARDHGAYHLLSAACPLVFTLGWWHPRIYVSEGLSEECSDTDLSIILQHEKAHQERRDNLRLLTARLCSAVVGGRLARFIMSDLQLLTEQACDFRAAERFGHVAVAETLLKIKRLLMLKSTASPELSMAFAERDVELRIKALLLAESRISLHPWQMGMIASVLLLSMSLMISPLHHGSEWVITTLSGAHLHLH